MRPWLRVIAVGGVLVTSASCGAASPGRSAAATADDPSEAPPDETDQERRVRIARAKRERCQEIGAAIEQNQAPAMIININDTGAAEKMAQQLAQTAERVADVEIATPELGPLRTLRDQYTDTTRGMADALSEAAAREPGPKQKAAIKEFSRLEPQAAAHLTDMNDYCNASVD
ncbi:MAG: hypothetical protein JRI23_21740 [Deltaproteobacteria bacterium]|jgi:sulfite reductase alpha subunit-like flavoprotein|nr:hypothetical protein [Deltaproteobacteria bacterium]MBW2534566.1 hypothetical protein [Deltaproteobacteria bacterium]